MMKTAVFNPGAYPGGWLISDACLNLLVMSWINPENFINIHSFHERTHKQADSQMHNHTAAQMHRHTDAQTDAQMHRCTHAQMHRRTDAQTHRCTDTQTLRHTDMRMSSNSYVDGQNNFRTFFMPLILLCLLFSLLVKDDAYYYHIRKYQM
jgi:hypothetical protein